MISPLFCFFFSEHKNTKVFLNHGGIKGLQEAIYCGVPIVGFPLFGDQHFNIKLLEHKKIAIKLHIKEFTAQELRNAINTVMNDPTYK